MLAVAKTKREPGIELVDVPEPKLTGENQVLIEVKACGICGSDLEIYSWEPRMARRLASLPFPLILGHEPAGTIVEVGKGVPHLKVGDRVACGTGGECGFCYYCRRGLFHLCDNRHLYFGSGAFARYFRINSVAAFKIPDDMPFQQAACLEPLCVSFRAIERSHLKPGDFALVIGAGPIGFLTAILARLNGASKVGVAGRSTSALRLHLAADLGFETFRVDEESFREKILSETGGQGADVVFECSTGGWAAFKEAGKAVRKGGEIILVGLGPDGECNLGDIMGRELTVMGSYHSLPSTWDRAIALVASGRLELDPIVTHVLPLENAVEGFEAMVNRKALKAVLEFPKEWTGH